MKLEACANVLDFMRHLGEKITLTRILLLTMHIAERMNNFDDLAFKRYGGGELSTRVWKTKLLSLPLRIELYEVILPKST